jgi:hypothetical protein
MFLCKADEVHGSEDNAGNYRAVTLSIHMRHAKAFRE